MRSPAAFAVFLSLAVATVFAQDIFEERLRAANSLLDAGQYAQAAISFEKLVPSSAEEIDPQRAIPVLSSLSVALLYVGNALEAEKAAVRARELCDAHPRVRPSCRLSTLNNLASAQIALRRNEAGEELLRQAIRSVAELHGEDDPQQIGLLANVGTSLASRGQLSRAEPVLRRALFLTERYFPEDHGALARQHHNLGSLHLEQRRLELARKHLEASERFLRATGLEPHPQYPDLYRALALLEANQRRYAQADAYIERAFAAAESVSAPKHLQGELLAVRAFLRVEQRRFPDALSDLQQTIDIQLSQAPRDPSTLLRTVSLFGRALKAAGGKTELQVLRKWSKALESHPPGQRWVAPVGTVPASLQ